MSGAHRPDASAGIRRRWGQESRWENNAYGGLDVSVQGAPSKKASGPGACRQRALLHHNGVGGLPHAKHTGACFGRVHVTAIAIAAGDGFTVCPGGCAIHDADAGDRYRYH